MIKRFIAGITVPVFFSDTCKITSVRVLIHIKMLYLGFPIE